MMKWIASFPYRNLTTSIKQKILELRVVYNTRVMLPSAKKDCGPTTQKMWSSVRRTHYAEASRQNKTVITQENSHLICVIRTILKLIVSRPYDNTLLQIQNAPKHIQTTIFGSLGKQDRLFIEVFWNLFTSRLKTQSCVDKKSSFSH